MRKLLFAIALLALPAVAQNLAVVSNSPYGAPPSAFKTGDTKYCYPLEVNNFATNSTYPHGNVVWSVVSVVGQALPPGLQVDNQNSNNNALNYTGFIDDGTRCAAPYAGATMAGTYHFTLRATDQISGQTACSSSDPVHYPNDCTGGHPLSIVVQGSVAEPVATLPQTYVDSTYALPSGGTTWTVGCTGNHTTDAVALQTDINSAQPGDVIVLTHGCEYHDSGAVSINGHQGFQIPYKFNPTNKWIYVTVDDYGSLPAPGTRIGPSNASLLYTLIEDLGTDLVDFVREGSGGSNAVNYWRFVGGEAKSESTTPQGGDPSCPYLTSGTAPVPYQLHNCQSGPFFNVVYSYDGTPATINNLGFDRMYIHGDATHDVVEGIALNCLTCFVVDSYISDIHYSNEDSQAVLVDYTPGPIKIHNSYLASTGEPIFFGGGGAVYHNGNFYDNPYVPSDIEVSQNTSGAEIGWYSCGDGGTVQPGQYVGTTQCQGKNPYSGITYGSPTAHNNQWEMKNDFECKNCQRALITGNQFSNSWVSGQQGSNVLFETASGQSGNSTVVQDITFQDNYLTGGDSCWGDTGIDYNCDFPAVGNSYPNATNCPRTQRIVVNNNLCVMNPSPNGGHHYGMNWVAWASEAVMNHNTVLMSDGSFPAESEYFQSQGFGCLSAAQANSPEYNIWNTNNFLVSNPNGDCGALATPVGSTLGWYEPNPSTLQSVGRFIGQVLKVPNSGQEFDWNSGALTGNDAVTSVTMGACGSPSIGNYALVTPDWSGHTTDMTQAGVNCTALCAAGACGTAGTLTVVSTTPPNGTVGVPYSYTLAATGGSPPYTWTVSVGMLPSGLTLSGATISGTPTGTGTTSFTIQATDSLSNTASAPVSITVTASAPVITTLSCTNGTVGVAYSCALNAIGGTSPYTWGQIFGTLPAGTTLNGSGTNWHVSGTPTAAGPYAYSLRVTDNLGAQSSPRGYAMSIAGGTSLAVTTSSLPSGILRAPYFATLTASGGQTPYTWSIIGGQLPIGLSLNATSGQITGTPTAASNFQFVAQVQDANNNLATATLNILIVGRTASQVHSNVQFKGKQVLQ